MVVRPTRFPRGSVWSVTPLDGQPLVAYLSSSVSASKEARESHGLARKGPRLARAVRACCPERPFPRRSQEHRLPRGWYVWKSVMTDNVNVSSFRGPHFQEANIGGVARSARLCKRCAGGYHRSGRREPFLRSPPHCMFSNATFTGRMLTCE